jgi:hypothetical protein
MPLTHKKKFKNRNYKNGSDITTKFKQKRRNVKSMMNKIIGGTVEKIVLEPLPRTNSGYYESEELENFENLTSSFDSFNTPLENSPIVLKTSAVVGTNTTLVKSNLESNPFYAKKSTHLVENKKMYSFDTNYIMGEIQKRQLEDPSFMPTSEFITTILANKPKSLDSNFVDHKKQAKLHRALCDFD